MNSILDVLFLRRPVIDYVSPAICESIFSGSSLPVITLNPLDRLFGPTGFVLGGAGSAHKLSWNNYPGALCYSVYKLVDELDPNGPYQLIAECITDNFYDPDPGTYRITAITPDGETPLSDPVVVPTPPVIIPPPPTGDPTIDVLGLDAVDDVADNALVVVGAIGGFSAAYKSGAIFTAALPGSTDGEFFAVSPNGHWVVGYDRVAGLDHATSYDFGVLVDLASSSGGDVGEDVSDDGAVLDVGPQLLLDAGSGATVASIAAAFPLTGAFFFPGPHRMNNARQVLCRAGLLEDRRIFRWESGVRTEITPADRALNNNNNKALGITEAGHSFGTVTDTLLRKLSWYNNGVSTIPLPVFGTVNAKAINESNLIVGEADGSGDFSAFTWTPLDGMTFLPEFDDFPGGGATSVANDVNNAGWIVGTMASQGFVYHDGEIFKLIDLIPALSGWDSIEDAMFINNLKTVVGRGTYLGTPNTWYIIQFP